MEKDRCENCKKEIDFVGLIWIPSRGPLKDFKLRFDTVTCVDSYKIKYEKYLEDMVGYEGQCTNIVTQAGDLQTELLEGNEVGKPPALEETGLK